MSTSNPNPALNDVRKLDQLIRDLKFAMLTTMDANDELVSRPLTTLEVDFNGTLWFMVAADAPFVRDVEDHPEVNLAYASPEQGKFVSVSGVGRVLRDTEKARQLWNVAASIWFPHGPEDPNLAVLEINVEKAEYWDSPGGTVQRLLGFAKAKLTGDKSALGEHRTVEVAGTRL